MNLTSNLNACTSPGSRRSIPIILSLLMLGILLTPGCQRAHDDPRLADRPYPADFGLVYQVVSLEESEDGAPTRQPGVYIVEPDRTLRVALGSGATAGYYPPSTATLTPNQMAQLWRLVQQAELIDQPADIHADDTVKYHIQITARGKRHLLHATPAHHPQSAAILRYLAELSGLPMETSD